MGKKVVPKTGKHQNHNERLKIIFSENTHFLIKTQGKRRVAIGMHIQKIQAGDCVHNMSGICSERNSGVQNFCCPYSEPKKCCAAVLHTADTVKSLKENGYFSYSV